MANPGDDLATFVFNFLDSGANDIWGLATAYAWYMKQCGVDVDMMAIVRKVENG